MTTKIKIIISIALILLGVITRTSVHLWNFTPIVAMSLFAGVYLGRNYIAPIVVGSMLIGDFIIGFYTTEVMLSVYGSFLLIGGIGIIISNHRSIATIIAGSISSSVLFYIVTNFFVWKFTSLYTQTFDGLIMSYTMALPFLRNMLIGDLVYTGVLFGLVQCAIMWVQSRHQISVSI